MLLRMFARMWLAGLLISSATAQEPTALLPLPRMEACRSNSHPRLPAQWRASYLMAPFNKAQLVLGEIVFDAARPAMRVKLFGVKRGAVDLFIRGHTTYVLQSEGAATKRCRNLGDTGWRPLPQDWLSPQSQCVGAAPVGEMAADWWKTPIEPEPASYWIWYRSPGPTPFRLVFSSASDRLAPLSRYALSYQVAFEKLEQAEFAEIAAACEHAKPAKSGNGPRALRALIDAMARSRHRADDEIRRLMPTLDAHCPATPFPRWPEQLAITGLMTPFDSDENPYPTEVLYDWAAPGQRTRTFGGPEAEIAAQDSLLLDPQGYTVTHYRGRELICRPVLPGTLRPDWASHASCECAAMIHGTTPLSPHGTTRILVCPLASPRVAWSWYALAGRPTVFMVTSRRGDEGKRLFAVLDYWDWLPGRSVPRAVFDKPLQCLPAARSAPARRPASKGCSTCHLGSPAPQN